MALSIQQNHRFKFSEFSLVGTRPTASQNSRSRALQHRACWVKLCCLKMADFLNIFAALEQGDCETISCTILDSNDDVILLAAVACFMREVTIPAYLSGEFENHFRMTRGTYQLLAQEIKHTGRNLTGNLSGRPAILPEKPMLLFLWSVANRELYRTSADAR